MTTYHEQFRGEVELCESLPCGTIPKDVPRRTHPLVPLSRIREGEITEVSAVFLPEVREAIPIIRPLSLGLARPDFVGDPFGTKTVGLRGNSSRPSVISRSPLLPDDEKSSVEIHKSWSRGNRQEISLSTACFVSKIFPHSWFVKKDHSRKRDLRPAFYDAYFAACPVKALGTRHKVKPPTPTEQTTAPKKG